MNCVYAGVWGEGAVVALPSELWERGCMSQKELKCHSIVSSLTAKKEPTFVFDFLMPNVVSGT